MRRRSDPSNRNHWGWYVLTLIALYIGVSMFVYHWNHPELTNMQMLFRTLDAVQWKK